MLSKRGKALLRRPGKISLAGDGLLERMRSTTFALLGITAALALGLVAIAAQQGWPDLPFSPLPGPAAEQGDVHDALVAAPPGNAGIGSAQPTARALAAAPASPTDGGGADKSGSRLSESRQLEVPVAGEEPAPEAPSGQDAAPPPSQGESPPSGPPAVAPTPTPESSPAPIAPVASPPSKSEPVAVSTTKDLDQDKDKDKAYGKYKSSSGKGGKSEKDEKSSDTKSKASTPPPAPPVAESGEYEEEGEVAEDKDDSSTSRGKDRGKAYEHKDK